VTYNHRRELHGDDGRPTFLEAYYSGCQVLITSDDFYDLAISYLARCAAMNVRYCEPFFDTQAHTERGIAVTTVLDGYLRAQHDGAEKYGVSSNWIFCFLRDRPVQEGLDAYVAARPWAKIGNGLGLFHAVGLASNEFDHPPSEFLEGFEMARKDGLHVTLHCDVDQKDVAAHIREAIFDIKTERIDHGLNALDDPDLIPGLIASNIGLTLCPHAYHRRQATEVLFPKIRKLIESGVKVCINSDDPTYMHDVWIDGNMQKVYTYCGLSKAEMLGLAKNAVEMCWADAGVKRSILEELDGMDVRVVEAIG
jgi:adenosine deaminase